MKLVLSLALGLAFTAGASACPTHEQSAEAGMTRVASLKAQMSTPVDPVVTSSTSEEAVVDASVKKAR